MNDESVGRHKKISNSQKQKLLEFMEKNPKLRKGKYDSSFTMQNARELWQKLTTILNSQDGPKKTWLYWRKTWHDMYVFKKNNSEIAENPLADTSPVKTDDNVEIEYLDVGNCEEFQEEPVIKEFTSINSSTSPSLARGASRIVKEELNNHILDNDDNVEHEYYKKILELMERQTIAFEIQAQSQQIQAETLLEMAETLKDVKDMLKNMTKH